VKVIIVGGGIGGLATAIALLQRGLDAGVYEAAAELRPVGKGIWVPTNAMIVFERLGLSDAVRQAGSPLERIQLRDVTDGLLLDVDLGKIVARYGHPTISIHRAELARVLAKALPAGTLMLNKRCASFEQDDRKVTVRFADGSTAEGDVLIGADGLHSAIRQQIMPDLRLRYSGQTCYRGIADWEFPCDLQRTCWEVWGGGGDLRIGFSRVKPGQIYWFAPMTAPPDSPWPNQDVAQWLAARYAAFPSPVPEVLRHTRSVDIIRTDLYDFAPLRSWSRGRVVLLGDAAHAMTPNLGQGGAQAIEDAYALAEELARWTDPQQAIRAYEKRRLPRARWFVNNAWRYGRLAHLRNRPARLLRNWLLKRTPDWVNARQLEWLYKVH
jgi:2-polyprenyl-6-methoxyphenol hydroxylase-like FAD-dependent oxidoreductase